MKKYDKFYMINENHDWVVEGIILDITGNQATFLCTKDSLKIHYQKEIATFLIQSIFHRNCTIIGCASKEEIAAEML